MENDAQPEKESSAPIISLADFEKIHLTVGQIKEIFDVEGKDKLYRLTIDAGEAGHRTILAGIKPFYAPQELEGKKVIVVANLASKKMVGFESRGMVLAAKTASGAYQLVEPPASAEIGSRLE